jgi:DNA repair exonuclease SbcCD ATPase subunit
MGLFRKKPKSIIVPRPATPVKPPGDGHDDESNDGDILPKATPPAPIKLDVAAKMEASAPPAPVAHAPTHPQLPPLPHKPKPKRNKKATVDPVDFLALRSEMMHLRARLDESEQARAMVEARLAAIDATTAAFASERNDISEVANMVIQLQQEITARPITGETPITAGDSADPALNQQLQTLNSRIEGLQDHGPKIAEFEAQLALLRAQLEAAQNDQSSSATSGIANDLETLEQLAAMQQRIDAFGAATQRVAELDYVHQRLAQLESGQQRLDQLDAIDQRLAFVDGLSAQLQQLNARIAAQAELGGQVSALRDRVNQLSERPDEPQVQLDTGATDELRDQLGQLAERMTAYDNEARAVREHMALLDQRLTSVGTELANQISELGRDIDGLGQRLPEVVEGNVSDEVVEALRGGQVKLANEQARYEIAFRQDLANLAEQLRRGGTQQPAPSS